MRDVTIFSKTAAGLGRVLEEAGVDDEAFERALPVCDLVKCRATCCHDGVILSDEEAEVLQSLGAENGVVKLEDGRWKTRTVVAREEELGEGFPDRFAKTRCVFLDDEHRCAWQLRAVEEGKHPWFYKPISCWMHPVLVQQRDGRPWVTILSKEEDEAGFASATPCGMVRVDAPPARVSLGMELKALGALAGRDFYSQVNASPGFSDLAKEESSG